MAGRTVEGASGRGHSSGTGVAERMYKVGGIRSPSSSPLPSAPLFRSYALAAPGSLPRRHAGSHCRLGTGGPEGGAGASGSHELPAADWAGAATCWVSARGLGDSVGHVRGSRQPLVRRSGQYFTEHPRSPELATAARREQNSFKPGPGKGETPAFLFPFPSHP